MEKALSVKRMNKESAAKEPVLLCEGDAKNFNRPKREIKRKKLDYALAQDEKKREKGAQDGQQERNDTVSLILLPMVENCSEIPI
jgi:hypothetical protein